MIVSKNIYRRLQQHLDRQPVGFPAVRSGADLRLLKRLFSEEQAALALHLSYRWTATEELSRRTALEPPELEHQLEAMFIKGSIARREHSGSTQWQLVPLVVGMYEFQGGKPSLRFLRDAWDYMGSLAYGRSLLAARPSQMRTIPVNRSISVEHRAAPYDDITQIVAQAKPPFVILNCICREGARMRRERCKKTGRRETCLGIGDIASGVLRRGHGREITREEALEILRLNEQDGLVFQPSGVQTPEFICSCCGCCCGMLGMQKKLPHPVDFWTSSFQAELDSDKCTMCGRCITRCQVGALEQRSAKGKVFLNAGRCIGCGLCVTSCSPKALSLKKKTAAVVPPKDEESLLEEIRRNKKGILGQWVMLAKIALGLRQ